MDTTQALAKLKALVNTSLYYNKDVYDRERLEEMKEILFEISQKLTSYSKKELESFFNEDLGYVTPKVDVRAVVFEDNRLLLVKEKTEGQWSLPGGWADVVYSPAEIAQKEVREESGLEVIPLQLFKLVDKAKHPYPKSLNYVYKLFFYCEPKTFELHPGLETSEARFFSREEVKNLQNISVDRNTREDLLEAFEYHNHPTAGARFDRVQ
ncbi:NUDIX hydrolase N-terminal domain-containing protein [Lactococcus petauri]